MRACGIRALFCLPVLVSASATDTGENVYETRDALASNSGSRLLAQS